MDRTKLLVIGVLLLAVIFSGCVHRPEKPDGVLSASELLESPIYDTPLQIYGQVHGLGEVQCTCFFLTNDKINLQIWYDMMVEDDGTTRPAVRVDDIHNDDWVVLTGELKTAGQHYSHDDFWLSNIEVLP